MNWLQSFEKKILTFAVRRYLRPAAEAYLQELYEPITNRKAGEYVMQDYYDTVRCTEEAYRAIGVLDGPIEPKANP